MVLDSNQSILQIQYANRAFSVRFVEDDTYPSLRRATRRSDGTAVDEMPS